MVYDFSICHHKEGANCVKSAAPLFCCPHFPHKQDAAMIFFPDLPIYYILTSELEFDDGDEDEPDEEGPGLYLIEQIEDLCKLNGYRLDEIRISTLDDADDAAAAAGGELEGAD